MNQKMQLLILCGGLGTRLKPLTEETPKPMLRFNDKPFLEHLINYYSSQGIKDFILSVGYLKESIINYFGDGKKFNVNITYSKETSPLGTAGALYKAKKLLKSPFLVVNGDTFMEVDVKELIEQHKKKNALYTMCVKKTKRNQNTGCVVFDKKLKIKKFQSKEITDGNSFVNTGIYLLDKKIFKLMDKNPSSLEKDIFPKIKEGFYAHQIKKGYLIDIGTFKTYNRLKREFKKLENVINN